MIKYVKRKDIDEVKYNNCIENAIQSRIYAFSWYLDIVADNWDILVLKDYKAVMPIPWRKKYGVKYVYQPLWTLELGVFSKETIDENEFLIELLDNFKYIALKMNTQNSFSMFEENRIEKQLQFLSLSIDDTTIYKNYRSDRKKDLRRAKKADLAEKWNDDSENLIQLFKDNIGKKAKGIVEKDYQNLRELINICLEKRVGEVLSIYGKNNLLVASGFFIKDEEKVSILVSSTDFKNRKNGANTFLIDRAIFKFRSVFNKFGFGGSTIKSIATYFLSFGAETEKCQQIKYNNLPKLLRLFKR